MLKPRHVFESELPECWEGSDHRAEDLYALDDDVFQDEVWGNGEPGGNLRFQAPIYGVE